MQKFNPNIHHRHSIRLKGYDYSREGLYFVTICCQDRVCRFGDIVNGEMVLNGLGKIAYYEWYKTTELRSNVELGEFIVMPNHIHGIIRLLRRGELNSPEFDDSLGECNSHNLGECNSPLRGTSQTIGAIIRGYKSSVTKQLGLIGLTEKLWQRNYYEHIIRNEYSYNRIAVYIIENPLRWKEDRFYTGN